MQYLLFLALALGFAGWAAYATLYALAAVTGSVTLLVNGTLGSAGGITLGPWPWLRFIEVWIEPFMLAGILVVLVWVLEEHIRSWPRG